MLGTSSAALLGLLYVVTSLHLDEIVNNEGYRRRARSNSIYLILTIVEAALILAPQNLWWLGIEVIVLNGYGSYVSIRNISFIFRHRNTAMRSGFMLQRAIVFNTSFPVAIAGGISLIAGRNWGAYLITASYLAILVSVALNAWAIMLGVGESERRPKTIRRTRGKKA
jgi:hypothetical protein